MNILHNIHLSFVEKLRDTSKSCENNYSTLDLSFCVYWGGGGGVGEEGAVTVHVMVRLMFTDVTVYRKDNRHGPMSRYCIDPYFLMSGIV